MKKFRRITLIAIIFLLSATLNVYAGMTIVKLTPSSTQVKVGETVTVILSAKCGAGIEGIDSTLEYDTTKLKLTNEAQIAASGFTSMSGTDDLTGKFKLSVLYTSSGNAPTEADFATLKFEVLDGANVGENLSIKLSGIELGDSDEEWEKLSDVEITLKVVEDAAGDEENPPADDGNDEENPPVNDGDDDNDGEDNKNTSTNGNNSTTNGNSSTTNGQKDNTTSSTTLPKAGANSMLTVVILSVAIVAIVMYTKNKKYQDII